MAACKIKFETHDYQKLPYREGENPFTLYIKCDYLNKCPLCSGKHSMYDGDGECYCPENLERQITIYIIYVNDKIPSEAQYTIVYAKHIDIIKKTTAYEITYCDLLSYIIDIILDNDEIEKLIFTIDKTSDNAYSKLLKQIDMKKFILIKSFRGQKTADKYTLAFMELIENIIKYEDTMQPKENAHIAQKKKKK